MSNDQFTLTGESINATKEKNIAVVKKIYADVSAKNLEGVFNSLTEDISWEPPFTAEIPHTKLRSGKSGVKDWVIEMTNEVTYSQVTPKDIFADDNAVIVIGYFEGKVNATGKSFKSDWVHVWKFRGDKIYRYQAFWNTNAVASALK